VPPEPEHEYALLGVLSLLHLSTCSCRWMVPSYILTAGLLNPEDPNALAHMYSEHEHGHREHAHHDDTHQKSHKHHGTDINAEAELGKIDPRKPVCCVAYKLSMVDWVFADTLAHSLQASLHGHKPSRGAELDWELQQDDEKRLREMGLK
jgi:ABC-type Zn2+ transport system substrate-binding protein/surface adhesin